MIIKACKFKRNKDSNWEIGITLELNGNTKKARDTEKVITEDGILEEVYEVIDDITKLCIDFNTNK